MKLIHDKAQAVISKVYDDMQISIEAKCLIIKLEIRYGWALKISPSGFLTNKVGFEKLHHGGGESHPSKEVGDDVMIKWQKVLDKVEGDNTGLKFLGPPSMDQVQEVDPHIGILLNTTKLAGMENGKLNSFILHPVGQHFSRASPSCLEAQ